MLIFHQLSWSENVAPLTTSINLPKPNQVNFVQMTNLFSYKKKISGYQLLKINERQKHKTKPLNNYTGTFSHAPSIL